MSFEPLKTPPLLTEPNKQHCGASFKKKISHFLRVALQPVRGVYPFRILAAEAETRFAAWFAFELSYSDHLRSIGVELLNLGEIWVPEASDDLVVHRIRIDRDSRISQ